MICTKSDFIFKVTVNCGIQDDFLSLNKSIQKTTGWLMWEGFNQNLKKMSSKSIESILAR